MQVSVENTGALERRLTVQVPGGEIRERIDSKLRELSKQVRIKGFRPGRVPLSVVKQRYGKQVRQDIVNETVQASLQQAIQEQELRPAALPRLDGEPEDLEWGDLEFKALIEIYPDIDMPDVAAIEIERPQTDITDEDVDEMLQTLREQRRTFNPVERKAKKGDQVAIDFAAETDDGRVPEEGTERIAIIMGESGFDALEKAIAKIEPGADGKATLEYPADFRVPALAGRKARTELKVASVAEGELPEVDEDFIRSFGVEDGSLDTLRVEIRGNLERELKQATNSLLKVRLIDELVKKVPDLEVPPSVVREEARNMVARMVSSQGQQPEPELIETLADQVMEPAERRVRAGLLMGEMAHKNGIRVDASKVREAIESIAGTYEQADEVIQLYYGNPQLMQQVESSVLEEQVVDWVLENAKVTPSEMKFRDVIAAATQATRQA
jgi:trigger factor